MKKDHKRYADPCRSFLEQHEADTSFLLISTITSIAVFMCSAIVRNPRVNLDKVSDKAGYLALHYGRISPYDVFVLGLSHIKLRYDCEQNNPLELP